MRKIGIYRDPGKWDIKRILLFPAIFILIFSFSASKLTPAPHPQEKVDLAKLKKEEEERKKKLEEQKKKSVVITNETLKQYEDKTKKSGKKKPPDKKKKQVKRAEPEKVDPKTTKEYWQKLRIDLEDRISKMKKSIESTQLELNRLTTEHLIMDLPGKKEALRRQKERTQRLLDGQKSSLIQLQAEYELLSEKARKAGVPPGWLR